MSKVMRGTIDGVNFSASSGLGELLMVGGKIVHCDAGPTQRGLMNCFGSHPWHWIGKEIRYTVDEYGILAAFEPVEDGDDE